MCSALIYSGDWASVIASIGATDILSNPYTRGASGAVLLHAFTDADVQCRHIESFAAFVDVKTA